MIGVDQNAVIDFLASPSTHGGAAVERIDTHAAIVFLAGTRAWKLKRAVRFDYLDFSTVAQRKAMCEADLVRAGIIDPTKVVRLALENAVSTAGVLLLTEATMTEVGEPKTENPSVEAA